MRLLWNLTLINNIILVMIHIRYILSTILIPGLIFGLVLVSALTFPPNVAANEHEEDDLVIEINQGVVRPITIAISPLNSDNAQLSRQLDKILANDLRLSGHMTAIKARDMPNQPFRAEQIIYPTWRKSKAEYLIFGDIVRDSRNKYLLNVTVADILSGEIRDSKLFKFNVKYTRDFGHYVSDYVYKVITGLDGSFSTKIAYVKRSVSRGKKVYRLIVADADGARERVIVTSDEPLSSPSWAPDSTKLAYVSFEFGRSNIFIQDVVSGKRQLITDFKGINSAPSWSPDGKTLAVVLSQGANADIYLIDIDTAEYKRVTRHPDIDTEPSWSKDGSKLLFTSDRNGLPQIYQYNLKTGKMTYLIKQRSYSASAHYTHNDKEVIMISLIEGKYSVVMYNLKSRKITRISKTSLDDSPSVSPDGNRVIYSTKTGGRNVLAIASVDLGNSIYLSSGKGDVTSVAWSPFIFKFAF